MDMKRISTTPVPAGQIGKVPHTEAVQPRNPIPEGLSQMAKSWLDTQLKKRLSVEAMDAANPDKSVDRPPSRDSAPYVPPAEKIAGPSIAAHNAWADFEKKSKDMPSAPWLA